MHPFWQSKTGQLAAGGCGSQLGLLLTCGGLAAVLSFCFICAATNIVTLSLLQQAVEPVPAETVLESTTSGPNTDLLRADVGQLLAEINLLEAQAPAVPAPLVPVGAPQKAVVRAGPSEVALYSGPGFENDEIGLLPADESLEIAGRNEDASWWLVARPGGLFAWVPDVLVSSHNLNETIPVVTAPSLLAQTEMGDAFAAPTRTLTPTISATPTTRPSPTLPPGTPTPAVDEHRTAVLDTIGYQALKKHLRVPPVSMSFSPDGKQIAITERIKVYTVASEGGSGRIWLEEDDKVGPLGGAAWSPDGGTLAFVVGFKHKYCQPCRAVALLVTEDETISFLTPPEEQLDTDMPRWLQDGRLMINAHPGEPADGVAYVYDRFGQDPEPAVGTYLLSSSHEGQKWYPWKPGRTWRAGVSERADSYNSD